MKFQQNDRTKERLLLHSELICDPQAISRFKSKRYRDKLRTEIKTLEGLVPVNRTSLHRKLDSQTVFRLAIAYIRTYIVFKDRLAQYRVVSDTTNDVLPSDDESDNQGEIDKRRLIEAQVFQDNSIAEILVGFVLLLTTDGTILYATENVYRYLGFNQVDVMHRCMYCLLHPHDHGQLKGVLENQTLLKNAFNLSSSKTRSGDEILTSRKDGPSSVFMLIQMKTFSGANPSYMKLQCSGNIVYIPGLADSVKCPNHVLFLYCRPSLNSVVDEGHHPRSKEFWSKHDMDLTFRDLDKKAQAVIGYESNALIEKSFYSYVHPEDLWACLNCHKALMETNEVQIVYFRFQCEDESWTWLQTRGKVIIRNSKKLSIVFSHSPIREADSCFLQQEAEVRRKYGVQDLFTGQMTRLKPASPSDKNDVTHDRCSIGGATDKSSKLQACDNIHITCDPCPSSWHALTDRHSPILPSSHLSHKITQKEKLQQYEEFKKRQIDNTDRLSHNNSRSAWHVGPCCNDDQEAMDGEYRNIPEGMEYYSNRCLFYPQTNIHGQLSNHNRTRQHWDIPYARTASGLCNNTEPLQTSLAVQRLSYYSQKCAPRPQDNYAFISVLNEGYPDKCQSLNHRSYFSNPLKRQFNSHDNTHSMSNQMKHFRDEERHKIHMCSSMPTSSAHDDAYQEGQDPKPPEINNNTYLSRNDMQMSLRYSPMKNCVLDALKDQHANAGDSSSQSQTRKNFYVHQYPITANCTVQLQNRHSTTSRLLPMPHYKLTSVETQSCAVASGYCSSNGEIIQCDVKTSIHMKIVDEPVTMETKANIELPTIGNFLEYLNDA